MRIFTTLLLGIIGLASFGQGLTLTDFFTVQEIKDANTAKDVEYLNDEEKDIFLYNNLARMRPQKFHKYYLAYCESTGRSSYLASNYYYRTLSEDLQTRQPAGPLLPDRKMFELAECWAIESGEKGILGHNREECPGGFNGENCAYGTKAGKDIVMQLLIDSGVESLGHRTNMLNPGWKGLGTAIRPHKGYGVCAVQDFTGTNDILRAKAAKEAAEREAARIERERLLAIRQAELEERLARRRAQEKNELMNGFTDEEISSADITRSLDYLSDFEKEFYFYYNLARMYPVKFKNLILEEGPYFDQFKEEQENIRSSFDYLRLAKHLQLSNPKPAFIPEKKYMDAGECIVRKWRAGGNSTSCLPGPGSWRLQTYYTESVHNDIINIFLTERDFDDLFKRNSHISIVDYDGSPVKVFMK